MKARKILKGALILTLAAGWAITPGSARAQDVRNIPPNAFLILDSSGSMEYMQHEHVIPECNDNPAEDDTSERTRWMMALDALLGPISESSFQCEFTVPEGHIIPHFVAKGDRDESWGILERYRELVRFGLATFDSFESTDDDLDGMWSYGPVASGRNVGIKRAESALDVEDIGGALVSFGPDDANMDIVNNVIRMEIEQTIPYCGSPVAAALDDAEVFFTTNPDNIPFSQGGNDRFWSCRKKFVILITDGRPNTGEGTWYGSSAMEAADLWSMGAMPYENVPTYVIGFSICPAGTTDGDEIRTTLNDIAHAGCPPDQPICPAGALFADDTYDLMSALDTVLSMAIRDANSRTVALTTNLVGDHAGDNVVQYQFNTALTVGNGSPWRGILERTSYVCNDLDEVELSTAEAEYVDYGKTLDDRVTDRTIWAGMDSADADTRPDHMEVFDTTNDSITAAALGRPDKDQAWADGVIDFIHGRTGTTRDGNRLADPFHASAAILEPPLQDLPLLSYYQYKVDQEDRAPVIFLATNDGVLHAFRVQDTGDGAQQAEELWGYIPGILLDKIQRQYPSSHDWNLDSTPTVADVRVFKDNDGDWTDEEWKSILIGGLRQGGSGYYAIDVTDPENPEYLWEIDESVADFADLGLTYATPFMGTAFTTSVDDVTHPLGEIAVAIFPGGMDPVDLDRSTGLYVVSADTGKLIKKLDPEFPPELGCPMSADCDMMPQCCAQLVSNPVGYGALPGMVTTRVFVGDDRGRVWRADMAAVDTDDWHLKLFYPDPDPLPDEPLPPYMTGQPIENPIGLAMDKDGKLVVLFGTGNVDDLPGMTQNYLFSLTEEYRWDSTDNIYLGKARFNWQITLEQGEKLIGQPIVFDEVAYFTTFIPYSDTDDFCQIGGGYIWGVHYNSMDPNLDGDESDFAQLDDDGVEGGTKSLKTDAYDNTIISGLTVVQRPSCLEVDPLNGVGLGSGQQEVFELVAQTSGPGAVTEGRRQTPTITMRIPAPQPRNSADSWGSLIE